MVEERLAPPQGKGHLSVARLARHWYVACRSRQLGARPLARTVLGTPLVLFRAAGGRPAALLDRCPHRNVPLSLGRRVGDGRLECAYHGWQLRRRRARAAPCPVCAPTTAAPSAAPRRSPRCERDGFVWVYATPDEEPQGEPVAACRTSATSATRPSSASSKCRGTLHAALENALDVPHTAFLHRGLFRGNGERHQIKAIVRASGRGVEAEYVGEPRPPGLVGRLLSPSGGIVEHFDRFLLPSIAQVEYRLGSENHLVATSLCTPVSDFTTRLYAVVSFRLRIPAPLVRPLLQPIAGRILRQDARILRQQASTIRRFGGEQFTSTEIDVLGLHIWRLLKQAEAGVRSAAEPTVVRELCLAV